MGTADSVSVRESSQIELGHHQLLCVETLQDALARHGKPDIFNTDQGSQFTGQTFTGVLADNGIAISMDGKGAWRDNVFVERLWRGEALDGRLVGQLRRALSLSNTRRSSLDGPFIIIKFQGKPLSCGARRKLLPSRRVLSSGTGKAPDMKKAVLALATAATIGGAALATPSPAYAWRGGWGWGPGLAGGLIAGAVIGGIASSAYAYGPGYGYYGGPGYAYDGGYAPSYYGGGYGPVYSSYGYAPRYYGSYAGYYGPRYRRVVRPAYGYPYRW
jgi:hypothetical protein